VDFNDHAAADAFIEKWLADSKAQNAPHLKAYEGWAKGYHDYRKIKDSEAFREENLRERLNAVRPTVSRITILPAGK